MKSLCFFLSFATTAVFAQKSEYAVSLIPDNLKENANAVVRYQSVQVNIASRSNMNIRTTRVVSILNESGVGHIGAYEQLDVKSIGATIYDAAGNEIKRIKRKDFRVVSMAAGSEITDATMTYLDYTPVQYPFTVVYESEVSNPNTAFIPIWDVVEMPFESVEKSEYTVSCVPGLGFRHKDYNFGNLLIDKQEKPDWVGYKAENIPAFKNEQYSPSLRKMVPHVVFGLDKFSLEGVDGEATDWGKFSAWGYNSLLAGTDELPSETQLKIKSLVGDETDLLKKARIVYDYMQSKTRYVSIQLGIGGWKPMKAKDVDRLGYGDCKALTNYTRALLDVVGVPSYYAVIYGDREKISMKEDFVSMQGNHIILAIPHDNSLTWLECTSQTIPFGFLGDFTDDRLALLVKPEGGALVRTSVYGDLDNSQSTKGRYAISPDGMISGELEITSKGIQYSDRMNLEKKSTDDLQSYYRDYFGAINNLKLNKTEVLNDKRNAECKENLLISATGYATATGNRLMFAVNAFNQYNHVPQRYRTRTNPIERDRGFHDTDEITITIPDGYSIEAKPENTAIEDTYGSYTAAYEVVDAKHIRYKRSLLMKSGVFPASDYEKFRKFNEQIVRADNAKCVLVKI